MKGFKVVKEGLVHNGFKYQEGLNIDTNPFRARGSCVSGGLYFFTDIKDVVNWLDFGVYLYEVEVPKGRRYVKDPDGDKYRSKYLILKNKFDLREVATWEYIIQQGVDIYALAGAALRWSAYNGHLDVVKYLVQNGADIHDDDDALRLSAYKGHLDVVKFLVEKDADIHAKNDSALRLAAEYGRLDVVKYLVEKGADIHVQDNYALRWAARYGHLAIVKYLVKNGANIHADNDFALRSAANDGHLDVVKYLVKKGADIHACNDLALRRATRNEHLEVVEYLKSLGANYEGI